MFDTKSRIMQIPVVTKFLSGVELLIPEHPTDCLTAGPAGLCVIFVILCVASN